MGEDRDKCSDNTPEHFFRFRGGGGLGSSKRAGRESLRCGISSRFGVKLDYTKDRSPVASDVLCISIPMLRLPYLIAAPIATDWNDSCRAGIAPTENTHLSRRTEPEVLRTMVLALPQAERSRTADCYR